MPETTSETAQGIVDTRKAERDSRGTQTLPANQEQAQVSEKKGMFGFLDFFAKMKRQKTAPPPAAPVEQSAQAQQVPEPTEVNPHIQQTTVAAGPSETHSLPPDPMQRVKNPFYDPDTAPDNVIPASERAMPGSNFQPSENPFYDPKIAPKDKVSPINESVASSGKLPVDGSFEPTPNQQPQEEKPAG